ncbi:hypothetical protein E2C01_017299 [Portunus trituberculatus]|uniref:Uncharacterized protein n=1 Tax=Portunus trituberculatus TaxID=210409 RepID=A0A5B7DRA7_PORTR|nr:hypothetical protein [Portunus trituberculatus]
MFTDVTAGFNEKSTAPPEPVLLDLTGSNSTGNCCCWRCCWGCDAAATAAATAPESPSAKLVELLSPSQVDIPLWNTRPQRIPDGPGKSLGLKSLMATGSSFSTVDWRNSGKSLVLPSELCGPSPSSPPPPPPPS